jgi:hypothetical protein
MRYLIITLIVIVCSYLRSFSQAANDTNHNAGSYIHYQEHERIQHFTGDFDHDGKADTVTITDYFGSSTDDMSVVINDGERNYTYEQEFTSGQFYLPIYINKKLFARYKQVFMDSVFPWPERNPDPALQWLMEANCSKQSMGGHSFDLSIIYTPVWSDSIDRPTSYKTLSPHHCPNITADTAVLDVYLGARQYSYEKHLDKNDTKFYTELKQKTPGLSIIQLDHALIVKKDGQYSWCFINDEYIAEGPEKLFWPSVQNVCCWGNFIFFIQNDADSKRIFVVDYIHGLCLRLNECLYNQETLSSLSLSGDYLRVHTDGKTYKFNLAKHTKASLGEVFK